MQTTVFECSKCGAQSPKWQGRCLECGGWGTMEVAAASHQGSGAKVASAAAPAAKSVSLSKVKGFEHARTSTGIGELDRVLGGGIVPGSLVLIGGDPGIGKSTLVMQAAAQMRGNVLYISGEESPEQIKLRSDRLRLPTDQVEVASNDDVDSVVSLIRKLHPVLVIVDSIQTMFVSAIGSEAGSVNQIKAACLRFLEVAKQENIPIWLIGHVTKDGSLGGPKTLEHYVDAVITFEGDEQRGFRLLRAIKNRFGSTSEVGMFEMTDRGLTEVKNPSAYFAQELDRPREGSVFTVIMEGKRPVVIEIQALVHRTNFGYPQRRSTGLDKNRLELLLAVLEKRCGVSFASSDVHVNIVGGLTVREPAVDLAVAMALISASQNTTFPQPTIVFGEVGLSGEVRPVHFGQARLHEAELLGITRAVIPEGLKLSKSLNIQISSFSSLKLAINSLKKQARVKSV